MRIVKSILKNNRWIYILYNYICSCILWFVGLFCKTDDQFVLFNSFGGAKYDDSPKSIYEYMKSNDKYKQYKMVWAINNPNLLKDKNIDYVKNNSIKFFILALKAKFWITNSSMERGLKFKKEGTIYINTWHGTALKKLGRDTTSVSKFRVSDPNIFFCQSQYDSTIFQQAFGYDKSIMKIVGFPRNDELVNISKKEIENLKNELKIPNNKRVIIYAPTFREYEYDVNGCFIAPPIDLKKWKEKLSDDYVVLFRAHYEVNKVLNIKSDDFVYNVTDYPSLNDLMKISDIMISDYSSIMIDYSILERPIYCYAYDYEEYNEKRGLYFDLNELMPNGVQKIEDELLDKIVKCDFEEERKKTRKFKKKFVEKCGNAASYIDEIILGGKK